MSRTKIETKQLSIFSGAVLDDLVQQERQQPATKPAVVPGSLFEQIESDIACKDCGRLAESCNCILE